MLTILRRFRGSYLYLIWHEFTQNRYSSHNPALPAAHGVPPLGMGDGKTRFANPADSFKLLYTAADLATAIAETIVRDRFEGAAGRTLNITGAKAQKEFRVFSQVLYVTNDLDGILSSARLRKQNCIATYHRAVPAHLTARAAVPVETLAHLVPALRRFKIKLNS